MGDRHAPADVFVAFGITGDLASVMTFHSLYKLERRGLLRGTAPASPGRTVWRRPGG
jgi:glucose-6-phosphate 1-dehydrogenase